MFPERPIDVETMKAAGIIFCAPAGVRLLGGAAPKSELTRDQAGASPPGDRSLRYIRQHRGVW